MTAAQTRVTLVVYKEIVAGDMRKLLAESNDSRTGGGARDLRLPAKVFAHVMDQIFTRENVGPGGQPIRIADVIYLDGDGEPQTTQLEYWPPTRSRPSESRIARIHASPALGGHMPETDRGRVFVFFTKFNDGTIRCDYAYEDQLRNGEWAHELSSAVLSCLASADMKNGTRPANMVPAQGYYDFAAGTGYCHAD
ncbi:hypothetical protein GCM10028789_26940 [Sinomonas halotolerans]